VTNPSARSATPPRPTGGLLHADAVRVLTAYQPVDRQQEVTRLDILSHLAAHPDAVWKSGPPSHLTASCLVLDDGLGRVLLTHHRRARRWFQFGGHLEPADRDVRAAAEREAHEESGLSRLRVTPVPVDLDRHRLVGDFGRCAEHLDIRYAATVSADETPRVSAESLDVRWWPVDALPDGRGEELEGLVRAATRVLHTLG